MATKEIPDARRFNPLGNYPSYTYQISLYMITPDAYDEFIKRNRTNIELTGHAFLIAQSGGINNNTSTRAPGFNFDYYIDDLKIKQAMDPKATGTSAATTELSFNIIEPYGFSFVTNLKKAADFVTQYSASLSQADQRNPSRQFYVLGIRFIAYNSDGSIAKEADGMFDKYWDIEVVEIKYKIDGKVITYHVKAAAKTINAAFGTKRGLIDLGASAKGITVEDMLLGESQTEGKYGIISKINYDQINTPGIEEPNRYNVAFIGPYADEIKNATIKSKADTDKSRTPMAPVNNTADVNVKAETGAVPDVNSTVIAFKNGTPILQAIQQIITQSSYITDALKTVASSEVEPENKTTDEIKPDTNKKLRWFNVSTNIANPRYDTKLNDFAYDITYVIQGYQIPVILAPNANSTENYYGPIKRYDYWYTGKNSEILKYEQTMDNSYYMVVLGTENAPEASKNEASISSKTNQRTGVAPQGYIGPGAESRNQVTTQLISPGDYAKAKIEILGDPDWLIQPSPGNIEAPYNQYYGPDGYTINPNGGQVFIEIDFKEAVDYDTNKGVLDINDSILFWDYPPELRKVIKGVSYRVTMVNHTFRAGKFTQELECVINCFGTGTNSTPTAAQQRETSSNATNPNGTTSSSNGLAANPPVGNVVVGANSTANVPGPEYST